MSDDVALQPRPTAWVTGGGALTYARVATTSNADAEDLDPAPQEEASTDGGLDDDAATDSDSESDGDEGAWAAADGGQSGGEARRDLGVPRCSVGFTPSRRLVS